MVYDRVTRTSDRKVKKSYCQRTGCYSPTHSWRTRRQILWYRAFDQSQDLLAKLSAEAMAEDRAGKTHELNPETLWDLVQPLSFVKLLPIYPRKFKSRHVRRTVSLSKTFGIQAFALNRYIRNYQFIPLASPKAIGLLVSVHCMVLDWLTCRLWQVAVSVVVVGSKTTLVPKSTKYGVRSYRCTLYATPSTS